MTVSNGSAPQAAPASDKSPIERWVARHMQNGGDIDDVMASARLFDELICASAIAETIAPKMFGLDEKLLIRESLSEVRRDLESSSINDLNEHSRVIDASPESPIGQWFVSNDEKIKSTGDLNIRHTLALNAAAARDVLADMRCAQAVARSVPGVSGLTAGQAMKVYDALCDHKERLAAQQERAEKNPQTV